MMKTLSCMFAGAAAIAALADTSAAFAQAKPAAGAAKPPAATAAKPAAPAAAPAAQGLLLTATTPGVCVLSREAILAASTVGKAVQTRLGQLDAQAQAELNGEKTSIETTYKTLETQKATLAPASYQQQGAALQQRANALQDKAAQRERELQATEQKQAQRILQEATPFVEAEAKAKNCAVVFDANAVMAVNTAMNLTPDVITALNGKVQSFDFEREHLDAQQAAQQK